MLVAIILIALFMLLAAVAIPGLLGMWKYPRRFGWKTRGFDTPGYLWQKQDHRANRERDRPSGGR